MWTKYNQRLLQDNVKKTMEKGLYQLEDGELVPEPTLLESRYSIGVHSYSENPLTVLWVGYL